ncbi:hypothetical protein Tco_0508126 [Tanacetum coccineum]
MSRDIDFEEGLKKKRGMITNEIFKMTSLNQQEKYEVLEKIRSDVGYVEAYWDMDDTNQDGWVKTNTNVAPFKWRLCAVAPVAHPSETPLALSIDE